MVTRRGFLGTGAAAAAAVTAGGLFGAAPAHADYSTAVDPGGSYGYWDGWGASLSWWANVFGMNDTVADLLYTLNTTSYNGKNLPGLGLNIVRYNLGASSTARANGSAMAVSPYIPRRKQIDAYWLDWNSSDPSSASWNWWVDSNQRNMLWKARDRGANLFELFSSSPVWWMCKNSNPSGSDTSGPKVPSVENIQSWNLDQHAVYLATVAKYAHDHWGFSFTSVEAFNEPSSTWWSGTYGNQEGCTIDRSTQETIIGHLRTELDARNLTETAVVASDENTYSGSADTWNYFDATTQDTVARINTHSYFDTNDPGPRKALYGAATGTPIWQSEYSEGYEHGLYLAYNLSLDMRFLHPSAWCYWQPIDTQAAPAAGEAPKSWGLVNATYDDPKGLDGTLGYVANKYFVMAQYSRHIRPGMRILDSGDQATVAAYDDTAQKLVLVTVRGDTAQNVTFDLTKFAVGDGRLTGWVTDANPDYSLGRQYSRTATATISSGKLTAYFPAYCIQTFEISAPIK